MVHRPHEASDFQQDIHVVSDPDGNAIGVIAIHSTALGPAAGGCRFWHYDSHTDLTADAIRLARGMSYKNALAGLPLGGGKAVLQRPAGSFDRAALFRAFGDAVEGLGGAYVTAEDVGTTVADMESVRERTRYVAGLHAEPGKSGGDPSPWTARGVFEAMRAAARFTLDSDLDGLTVAVQGTGNVGAALCRMLRAAGARLVIADVDRRRVEALVAELGARAVGVEEITGADADIFAPCALGSALNAQTIPALKARLVCGAANNQLETEADGEALLARGIVYAPDYVVNAGGIINVCAEYLGEAPEDVAQRVGEIAPRLTRILEAAARDNTPPHVVADTLACRIIARGQRAAA
jgi:leucine dehydrogenase